METMVKTLFYHKRAGHTLYTKIVLKTELDTVVSIVMNKKTQTNPITVFNYCWGLLRTYFSKSYLHQIIYSSTHYNISLT